MKDLVRERACKDGPDTCFRVTKQIDGVFETPDIDCFGSRFFTFWYGMGDHKGVVVDIPYKSLLGEQVLNVVFPEARSLQCGLTGPKRRYLQKCKTLFQ